MPPVAVALSWQRGWPFPLDVGNLLPPAMIPEVGGNHWMVMSLVMQFALVLTSSYGVWSMVRRKESDEVSRC